MKADSSGESNSDKECCHSRRITAYLTSSLAELPFSDGPLASAMRYALLCGGKRLRPKLIYLVGELFGTPLSQLDPAAAAIECIHAYSLIHDDLPDMDDSAWRRGRPTTHIKFGTAHAILAGDALQAMAFSLLSTQNDPWIEPEIQLSMVAELARAAGVSGLCSGQSLDLQAEHQQVDLSHLERIHYHKTGALLRCAVRLGALAAGEVGVTQLSALSRFADNIGLAFQIKDDLLDLLGESSIMGKPTGADLPLGKSTYPVLLGVPGAQQKMEQLYLRALETLVTIPKDTTELRNFARLIIDRDH